MPEYQLSDVKRVNRLLEAYGEEIELTEDGRNTAASYNIVLEFEVGDRSYAVLRAVHSTGLDDYMLFRVKELGDGEYEIESIDDDDEWENISELVDEMTTKFTDEA
ncbi:DUF1292 domain-containing protein [Paenibacillus thermotolerans]|uniref:DUF1292 domain-containing protein n=1 Tax=Paenibacillus thermotolerans TaxID=3027807 RepID=UPI002367AAB2|nr:MULTISPECIES: DUF1292 domain-containing protein [unclassified Paenibacillus]